MATVLVVDDNQLLIDIVVDMLRQAGYETAYALNGEQAMALLRHRRFDAVVVDHYMPGMTGAELARYIKTSPALYRLPVIGLAGSPGAEKELAPQVDAYLKKPVVDADLVGAIRSVLG